MATGDKKDPVYFQVKTGVPVYLKLNLDPDLYSATVLAKAGGSKTKPADGDTVIPVNKKYAIASGAVIEVFAKVERVVGTKTLTRKVPILIEAAKSVSIGGSGGLENDTIKLGHGATPADWTVVAVTGG